MEQVPNHLDDGAFGAPTNGLLQPLDINPLLEEEAVVPPNPPNPPDPEPPRDDIDSIMAQADDFQTFRDYEEYLLKRYDSDSDSPEDSDESDAEYSDAD